MRCLGVMSGTSCDGVDLAIVDVDPSVQTLKTAWCAYPSDLRNQVLECIQGAAMDVSAFSRLDAALGQFYAESINVFLASQSGQLKIDGIGLHGQTVYHAPGENTIQLGSAAIVAAQTGLPTVANFRQLDVAFGGQGAPLAPALHREIFGRAGEHVGVLNLGGIANITYLSDESTLGFDTGPANCLMDEWVHLHLGHSHDANGQWAEGGGVIADMLQRMLADPYFHLGHPKSTGREHFNQHWLASHLLPEYKAQDVQRTLAQLTVDSVVMAVAALPAHLDELIVCGGGVHNDLIMSMLTKQMDCVVNSSAAHGLDPDHIESTLMGWLASQRLQQRALDLTTITGTQKALPYGLIYRP